MAKSKIVREKSPEGVWLATPKQRGVMEASAQDSRDFPHTYEEALQASVSLYNQAGLAHPYQHLLGPDGKLKKTVENPGN